MTREDTILAECVAQPDSDAPRMVWADAVGGERGELVVLQCARDGLPRAERTVRNRRERELVAEHGLAWSGLAGLAHRVQFRRGFVDAIEVEAEVLLARGAEIFARAPLVTALTVRGVHSTYTTREGAAEAASRLERIIELPAFGRLRALDLVDRIVELDYSWADGAARVLARTGALTQLTALGLPFGLTATGVTALASGGAKRLERVWLRDTVLRSDALRHLAEHAPRLVELDLNASHIDFAVIGNLLPHLHSLVLRNLHPGTLVGLATSELARGLHRLVLEPASGGSHLDAPTVRLLAQFPRLRELELRGFAADQPGALAELARVGLPELRVFSFASWTRSTTELEQALAVLAPRLDVLDLRAANRLESVPEGELDILVDEPRELLLLHAHAAHRAPWVAAPPPEHPGPPTAPAWLVGENGARAGQVWDLGYLGASRIRIGRGAHGDVVLPSGTVARTHAIVTWHDGAFWIRDMRSTNGTKLDGRQIDGDEVLRDGMRLTLGGVMLRFFTGPGGGTRASDCARRVATHEPLSGLPRAAREEAAWLRIANLHELERQFGEAAADHAIAEVAARLIATADGAELGAPQRNEFRIYPRERAPALAVACAEPVEHEGLMLEIRIATRPLG